MNAKEVDEFYTDSKPVIYKKHKYLINSVNDLNNTVGLVSLSVIGQEPSESKDKLDIPFSELEV